MRSKEVDEAIDSLKIHTQTYLDEFTTDFQDDFMGKVETVLSYIEELEKMIPTPENEVPVEYQTSIYVDKRDAVMKSEIRDKIKELKSINFNNADDRDYIIKVLKSIIGE